MNAFQKKFQKLLTEAPGDPELPDPVSDEEDAEAFEGGLDQGTNPDDFNDVPENPINDLKKQQYGQTMDTLQGWIGDVEGWIEQLNGLDEGSMNHILNKADCDSVMADIRRSESKKISRLAQDLSGLGESLKQYLLQAQQKKDSNETI